MPASGRRGGLIFRVMTLRVIAMTFTVEELAAAAGVTVDTIRYYQARGLLPRPQRRRRRAIYTERHLRRLRDIRRYQAEGLSLAVIRRLVQAEGTPRSRKDALLRAVSETKGEPSLTRAQLAAELGIPEALLISLETARLLRPHRVGGELRYTAAERELLRAGLEILGQGFPLDELLRIAVRHARNVEQLAEAAVGLFNRHVRQRPGATPEEVTATFHRVLPAAVTLVAGHFQHVLLSLALDRLAQEGDQEALDAAMRAVGAGHLEIRWR